MEFYKLCLKFKLIGNSQLVSQLVYVNDKSLTINTNGYNYILFDDVDTNLSIWSFGDFNINYNGIRLPQYNNIKDDMYSSFNFKSDEERYKYLKKLYQCLNRWACDKKIFKDESSSPLQNNVIINDQFWFVY